MIALYIIIAVLLIAVAASAVHAAFYKAELPKKKEMPVENVNMKRVQENLSRAIQFKTISHEDESQTDWAEFDRYHEFLRNAYPKLHSTLTVEKVSKAGLLYFWQGKDESLEPIAFLSHQDVVPVADGTEKDWEHPAFEGYNDGEYIWGRGAIDMKNHLICLMESIETLLEEGYQPERSVYLCFGYNEEIVAGKNSAARDIAAALKEKGVHLDSVFDEGGVTLPVNIKGVLDADLSAVGVAEKGYADFKITVNGKGGHSSQPPKHTALGKLSNKIVALENHQMKPYSSKILFELISTVGRYMSYPLRFVLCNVPVLKPLLTKILASNEMAFPMVRTSAAVTMSSGSPAANVLPQKATATINFRIMPGDTIKDVENHLEKYMGGDDTEIELVKGKEASKVSPTNTKAFETIKELMSAESDKSIVVPYLVTGGTDAYNYEPVCDNIYRFSPFTISNELLSNMHSTNERIPISQLNTGVTFFKRYIRKMTSD